MSAIRFALLLLTVGATQLAAATEAPALDAETLAGQVTIYRDEWGTPHIDGKNDAACCFGMAWAQCEDYFWQVEDSIILGSGRYAEAHGRKGLNSDLLNRAFEIVPRSKADFAAAEPAMQQMYIAFTEGINHYLKKHPEVKPRLITHFEPWMIMAMGRQVLMEFVFRYTHLSGDFLPRSTKEIWTALDTRALYQPERMHVGSNAWAINGSRTKSGKAMLYINPHQPWFGFGQFYEAHLRSGEGWQFSGGTFFGNPLPGLGFNEYCGWAFTVNEPDIADIWTETFDDPKNPLNYRYDGGYRTATEWKEPIKIKQKNKVEEREFTFRKTHHGPIVRKDDDTHFTSAMIAKLYDGNLLRQVLKMVRAKNFDEWRAGMSMLNFQFMNTVYADRDGNIFYIYNGTIPKRDPSFDWAKAVDGSNPKTEWQGYFPSSELPQSLNPPSGFVQSCNSTPFAITDDGNPLIGDFPRYMAEDQYDDKRRSKISKWLLRQMSDVTFEDWQRYALDTTLYWPMTEFPRFKREHEALKKTDPSLAEAVEPYLAHLFDWNYKANAASTQATLCQAWYEELYGFGYPAEVLKPEYIQEPKKKYTALIKVAGKLKGTWGDWKVPWGDVHRIQRHADVSDFVDIPFDDNLPSLPCDGVQGPLGVAFVTYYTPTITIPLLGRSMKKQYGVVGNTYMACVEFGDQPKAATLMQFGESGLPDSPHFFDQAKLLSERKFKPGLFDWEEIKAKSKRTYQPAD
jgi:penicillin amidase